MPPHARNRNTHCIGNVYHKGNPLLPTCSSNHVSYWERVIVHLEYYGDSPVKRYGNTKENMKRVLLGILSKII